MAGVRITERENELTTSIDACDTDGIVRTLRQTDAQLFSGWRDMPALNDTAILSKIEFLHAQALDAIHETIEKKKVARHFVFSGCGTSGRIAWLCAHTFNAIMKKLHPELPQIFHYRISGGDEALVLSKELPEDDPHLGMRDVKEVTDQGRTTVFGITCGLSAPYVAGQIHHAMHQAHASTVLIGFNPVALARNAPIEGWDLKCYDVFNELAELEKTDPQRFVVLNPIVGPEPITGSSRMKGGSVTKLLLDAIFIPALAAIAGHPTSPRNLLQEMEQTYREAYGDTSSAATIVGAAGQALQQPKGHLYYVGRRAGLMGLIDASEMVDTYGCRLDEVRAFIAGGWTTCGNREGDISTRDPLLRLFLTDFEKHVLPHLSPDDCVVFLSFNDFTAGDLDVIKATCKSSAHAFGITVAPRGQACQLADVKLAHHHQCTLTHTAPDGILEPVYADFALKLLLNAVTTGANIIKGAVYGHTMINLTVSNNKLFQRSVEIVSKVTGCSLDVADRSLRRSICMSDDIASTTSVPLSQVIEIATPMALVVPTACLLAAGMCHADAAQAMRGSVRLRDLIRATVLKAAAT